MLEGGELWTPIGATASTDILKLPSRELKRISINELFMLQLATDLGLPVVDARLWPVGADNALLVTRFDRAASKRIHQEDFCQATGRSPKQKYQEEGGPSFAEIVKVIREESAEPAVDVDIVLSWLAFNVICGNADGHAKNLALVRTKTVRLAPLYDLVCTRAWSDFSSGTRCRTCARDAPQAGRC